MIPSKYIVNSKKSLVGSAFSTSTIVRVTPAKRKIQSATSIPSKIKIASAKHSASKVQ